MTGARLAGWRRQRSAGEWPAVNGARHDGKSLRKRTQQPVSSRVTGTSGVLPMRSSTAGREGRSVVMPSPCGLCPRILAPHGARWPTSSSALPALHGPRRASPRLRCDRADLPSSPVRNAPHACRPPRAVLDPALRGSLLRHGVRPPDRDRRVQQTPFRPPHFAFFGTASPPIGASVATSFSEGVI